METTIKALATKDDIRYVREDIRSTCKDIGDAKSDTIKWMFIFWIGQVAAMLAIVSVCKTIKRRNAQIHTCIQAGS